MAFADSLQSLQESLQGFDINDLDFESIGSWPVAIKVIVWLVAFGACFVLGYQFDIKDVQGRLVKIEAEEGKLREEYRGKAFQAANLEAYRKQMKDMQESFGALVGQLPSDTEVPGLLEDITNKGVSSGLEFQSIDLQPEKRSEFYIELPIQISVKGTYHDMGAFVSGVAGLPRIVTLHNFEIKPTEEGNTSTLSMGITAKTYRYKEAEVKAEKKGKNRRKSGGRNR